MVAFVLVKTDIEQTRVIRTAIRQSSCEVTSVDLLWGGPYDLLVTLEVDSPKRMADIVSGIIQQLPGVCGTMTHVRDYHSDD